ncbi:hypothetical protein PPBDW_II0617 [Photobacterium kishitanii]|nr:hypothetical protein PPBDW_II0617 [Photobacterium kishitanii]
MMVKCSVATKDKLYKLLNVVKVYITTFKLWQLIMSIIIKSQTVMVKNNNKICISEG